VTKVQRARGLAFARAALAGNPSDGYGGAVLAVTLPAWWAEANATRSPSLSVEPASEMVEAAVRRFARELEPDALGTDVRWTSSVPRGVGLGGSSALVIATIKALCQLHGTELEADALAALALAVEAEDMGIVAGLQDRVAQAYGGLTFMDFSAGAGRAYAGVGPWSPQNGAYERLDAGLLPPFLIAWRPDASAESGEVHASLRERHRRGEEVVHDAMSRLADAARGARAALLAGDLQRVCLHVDESFELRRRMLDLDARCVEMVAVARANGASANYTGSGGAIVAIRRDAPRLDRVERALRAIGCEVTQYP
jgi:galactokinase/mevalonate kinase-like predicted kinase